MATFYRWANIAYQTFFNPEWDQNAEMLSKNQADVVTLVVAMLFPITDAKGHRITPDDIAEVLKYRDRHVFKNATGSVVTATFATLERNRDDPLNPYKKWDLKRRIAEKSRQKGLPHEVDEEFEAVKERLLRHLKAVNERN